MKIILKNIENKRRPWWRFGPGTIVAIIIAAAVVVWQSVAHPSQDGLGQVTYEADASGRLQRTSSHSSPVTAGSTVPPLWKPEVQLLLDHSRELHLSPVQVKSIQRMDADWLAEKADLQQQIDMATGDTDALLYSSSAQHKAPLASVKRGMADYSRLSEEFNQRRTDFWIRTTRVLTTEQCQKLDGIRMSLGRKRLGDVEP